MQTLYLIVFPSIIIGLPIIFQIILTAFRVTGKSRIPIWSSFSAAVLLEIIAAFIATVVSTHGFVNPENPEEFVCATGAAFFLVLGVVVIMTIIPLIGMIGGFMYDDRNE